MTTKYYYNRFISYKYQFKEWFFENVTPHLPKIQVEKPRYPGVPICAECHKPPHVYALDTGDGWLFFWDCECGDISDLRGDDSFLDGYFPFLFGWATGKDLGRIGIEVV